MIMIKKRVKCIKNFMFDFYWLLLVVICTQKFRSMIFASIKIYDICSNKNNKENNDTFIKIISFEIKKDLIKVHIIVMIRTLQNCIIISVNEKLISAIMLKFNQ